MGYVGSQDMTERDPKAAQESFDAFKELVTRFPGKQVRAGRAPAHELPRERARSAEVHVARYYLSRGAYVAAVNRAQYALTNYPKRPRTNARSRCWRRPTMQWD